MQTNYVLDRDTFHTFPYRSGYITTRYNRITQSEEVDYQIDNQRDTAQSVHAAKILISRYMRQHPYVMTLTRERTEYVLEIPRHRNLSPDEITTINYTLQAFSFVLCVSPTVQHYRIDPDTFADKISKTFHVPTTPLVRYQNVTHQNIQKEIISALERDRTFFDDLSAGELISDLAETHRSDYKTAQKILEQTQPALPDQASYQVKICVDLLRTLQHQKQAPATTPTPPQL